MNGYITTFTGMRFSHEHPTADMIDVRDIAHSLSMLCHWNGHCREFFSVAQHSVLVSMLCPTELARWGLLHDAAEAYCGDMTRPLKVLLPEYRAIEQRVMDLVTRKFYLPWPEPPELKQYDNQALRLEAEAWMNGEWALHDGFGNPIDIVRRDDISAYYLESWTPRQAEDRFLRRFNVLFQAHVGIAYDYDFEEFR